MTDEQNMINDYITTLPEDRIKRHLPRCHYCGEEIEGPYVWKWYGNLCHEECLRDDLMADLETAMYEAKTEAYEYWE